MSTSLQVIVSDPTPKTTTRQGSEGEAMSHTPGPWKVDKELCSYAGVWLISMDFGDGSRGSGIARTCAEAFDGDPKSNAHLIAAAPELLAVLEELRESASYWSEYDVPLGIVERIESAIRKARGEE